ncbi:MAG: polyprenyl diphosphate synthase [Firmicutes bacterium]|nr:polyprenyl diphosphate synthase [Bacillota bacterium]
MQNNEIKHIAFIPDGNGRWAKQNGLQPISGYTAGASAVLRAIESAVELQIPYLTFYAFSSENFKRAPSEVRGILFAITEFLETSLLPLVKTKNIKVVFVGNLSLLPPELLAIISKVNSAGLNNSGTTVAIAIAYGGQEEITNAVNRIFKTKFELGDDSLITYNDIKSALYTACLPDPDLVIRYGSQKRLSNFMPLQTVYSELMFWTKLWPDFDKSDLLISLAEFSKIKRTFGE